MTNRPIPAAPEYHPGTYAFPRRLFRDARRGHKAQKIVARLTMPVYARWPWLGLRIGRAGFWLIQRQEYRNFRP